MPVYQGRFPRDMETDSVISSFRGGLEYPMAYGYACVGVVRETGKQVDKSFTDTFLFSFQPHTSHFICKPETYYSLSHSFPLNRPFSSQHGKPPSIWCRMVRQFWGECVLVFGQGVVGLLTASLLGEFPLETLVTAD